MTKKDRHKFVGKVGHFFGKVGKMFPDSEIFSKESGKSEVGGNASLP